MSPWDPSLFFAASVLLDLIYDTLRSKHSKDEAIGFWAEWLAWAILLVFYWTAPILHRHAAASAFRAGLEEAADSEKCPQPKYDAWVAPVLSVCLVGVGVLWQSENEKYSWTLVSQTNMAVRELRLFDIRPADDYYARTSCPNGYST